MTTTVLERYTECSSGVYRHTVSPEQRALAKRRRHEAKSDAPGGHPARRREVEPMTNPTNSIHARTA